MTAIDDTVSIKQVKCGYDGTMFLTDTGSLLACGRFVTLFVHFCDVLVAFLSLPLYYFSVSAFLKQWDMSLYLVINQVTSTVGYESSGS